MIFRQTLRACPQGKLVPTLPDHALVWRQWCIRCQFGDDRAGRGRPQHLSLYSAGHKPRSHGRSCRCRRLVGSLRVCRAFCRCAAYPGSCVRCELPICARDQRSDHRHPAVFAIRDSAVAGASAACERIPVHRGRSDRSRLDLSRSVCSRRAFERRSANHSLAVHGLARRISAFRARLCAAERQGRRRQNTGIGRPSDPGERHRGRRLRYQP